jgi:hypothetical protein
MALRGLLERPEGADPRYRPVVEAHLAVMLAESGRPSDIATLCATLPGHFLSTLAEA